MSINESNLVKKLTTVTNTQDSVQTLSLWIIHHRAHHRKIVDIWAKVLKKSKPVHRLTMLYLANDVLQNGKRKGVQQFIESFADILPEQTPLFRDERISKQVDRVFSIWAERSVFSSDFTAGLKDILHNRSSSKHHISSDGKRRHKSSSHGTKPTKESSKKEASGKAKNPETERIILEFKPETTIDKIKKLKKIELETSTKLANLTSRNMDVSSSEVLRKFKDRSHGQQFQKDFDEATRCLEEYIKALEKEVAERAELVGMLEDAKVYYDNQNGEARIVATAYKNFGNRVKGLKKKLEAKVKTLPSPVPSPTPDAPSPTNSDDGLQLPAMQDTAPAVAPDGAEPTGNGDSPGSAPSPEGSPDGLSPVVPETGDSATTSNATGNAAALSSFMSQSPTVLSSWLDAFNQEFQESKAVSATVNPSLLAAAIPTPSTLESRLSNLMQTMGHIPGGLFSSAASSASNTPKRADSPPYASAAPRPAAAVLSEVHSGNTPLKDENSGQGTPVLDENSARKAASLLDSDMRVHPTAKPNTTPHDSPEPRMNAAFGSKIPSLASPNTWAQASPTAAASTAPAQALGAPALAPPPLPPALQAYLEPIQTVTGAAHRSSTVVPKGRSETPPSPSADYLIPVAENFDVTDMDLDDESGDDEHTEAALHRNKKLSNLITLVQPEVSPAANKTATVNATATTTSGEGSEDSQPEQPILPSVTVASVLDIASTLANQANLRSLLESIELAKQEPSCDFLTRNSPLEPRSREPTSDFLARNSPLETRSREPTSDFLARNSPLETRSREPTSDFLARNSPLEPRSREPTADFLARNSPLEPRSRELTSDFLARDSPLEPRLREPTADFLTRESSVEPRLREPASDFLTRDSPLETRSRDPTTDFLTRESPSEPRLREPSSDFLARESALEPRLREQSSDFHSRDSSSELHSREAADFRARESSSELRLRESSDFTTRESSEFRLRESADFATRESSEFRLNESSDYMTRERSEFQVRESPSSDFRMRESSSSSEFHVRDSSSEFRVHDSPSSSEFQVHDAFGSDFHAAPAKIETVQMRSSLDRSPPLAPLEDRGGVWERGDYYPPRTSHHQLQQQQQQQQQHHQPMSNGGNRSRGRGSGYYGYEMRGRPMDRFREGYGSYDPDWHTGRPPSPRYRPYGVQQQQQQQRGAPYFQPRY